MTTATMPYAVITQTPGPTLEAIDLLAEDDIYLTLDVQEQLAARGPAYALFLDSIVDRFRSGDFGILSIQDQDENRAAVERNAGWVHGVYYDRLAGNQEQIQVTQTRPQSDILVDQVAPAWRVQ